MEGEPLTSLLIRELRILARDHARLAKSYEVTARVLRQYGQPDVFDVTMARTQERLDREKSGDSSPRPIQPSLLFGSGSEEDHD